ncbi:probable glucan endo-1,3-beta-glucosidase BG4 [Rhodamnia argentea]|uniref:glucan endo-1,3-beta-D-glucosidase n=1 Tax=Rhodamnia argentea TaxID=178133 RepID=A0ABM3HJ03_9MYRT|nr:probable glucan endo-1,3-beta-glucosidase BG4 [Rhodamnia argentea]
MEKEGMSSVDVVVSESGWPSGRGGLVTTPQFAQAYNQHFVKKFMAMQSTPKRPNHYLYLQKMSSSLTILVLSTVALLLHYHVGITEADIGVNYVSEGFNRPPPATVVQLLKSNGIGKVRLFDPNVDMLNALAGSGIDVTLGIPNQDIRTIASSYREAMKWFNTHVLAHTNCWRYLAEYVLPAMQNIQAIKELYQLNGLRVTTVVGANSLGSFDPPSSGAFYGEARPHIVGILKFLSNTSSPLLVNVYPYFVYASDPAKVRLEYALGTATVPLVQDGNLGYKTMLDAMVDAYYWAMEKEGVSSVDVVVSESGWPSGGGGLVTTPLFAQACNQHFVKKFMAMQSTPKRPDHYLEGFIFEMFNDDQKSPGVDQHWGLFKPDGTPVYPVFTEG